MVYTNQYTMKEIENTVIRVRAHFTKKELDYPVLTTLYQKYNPQENIELFITRSKELFPFLNCGLASLYLQHIFGKGSIINGSYKGYKHTFLLLSKNLIVDITADQFGGPPYYIGSIIEPWDLQ